MTIAFQGDAARAAARAFEPDARLLPLPRARRVVEAVASGEAERGVVAVEDTAEGSHRAVLDALVEIEGVRIVSERWAEGEAGATRFLLLTHADAEPEPGAVTKTTLVLTPNPDVPNALFRSLTAFVGRRLAVHNVDPRPRPDRPGHYRYVVDVEGDAEAEPLVAALVDLAALNEAVQVLGSYPTLG